jgi:hypothetical protein
MLLSRFWYVFLAVAAGGAVGAAMLAQGVINGSRSITLEEALRRDRFEMEAFMRLEARQRLDRIGFISVDSKTGQLLRQAAGLTDEKRLLQLSGELKDVLRSQVKRVMEAVGEDADSDKVKGVEPDIVFALDIDGRIIAQLGPMQANPPGSGLGTYPLVKRALQGYVRDDVWVYDRKVYRMAARPVMYGSDYAGAIVHGYRFDQDVVANLSKNLGGASVAFYRGTNVLASYTPTEVKGAPEQAELIVPLPEVFKNEKFLKGERTDPIALQSGARAVYAPIRGAAADAEVGYVIARPLELVTSPMHLFDEGVSKDDVKRLPLPVLIGGVVLLAAIGLLFITLENDRPFKLLRKKTAEIAAGNRDRLIITEWRGGFRSMADAINQAIDKEVEKAARSGPTTKKKANLDEILGPTPETDSSAFFGFAGGSKPSSPGAASPAPAPAPLPAAPSSPGPARAPAPPSAPNLPPRAAPTPPAAALSAPVSLPGGGEAFDEPAHWREIFQQYLSTRKQCGEATDNLTFEKFSVTLQKTRDQILSKHTAHSVRFAVQVKEGKAALKAQPVKK